MTLQASLDALTHDAKEWHDTSTKLQECVNLVARLQLTHEFSWMGYLVDTQTNYEAMRSHIETILKAGVKETDKVGDALVAVRDTFEGTDQAAKDKIASKWKPVI